MNDEKPQISPIQRDQLDAKREWDKKGVLDLPLAELQRIAQTMRVDRVIVIGANDAKKQIMVSVLNMAPELYKAMIRNLYENEAGTFTVERDAIGETYTMRSIKKRGLFSRIINRLFKH